jgi:hypothetical protein
MADEQRTEFYAVQSSTLASKPLGFQMENC